MKLKKNNFFSQKVEKKYLGSDTFSIVSCSIRDPSPRDFYIMTLNMADCKIREKFLFAKADGSA